MPANGALQLRRTPPDGEWLGGETPKGLAKQDSMELEAGSLPVFFPKGGMFFLEGQFATGSIPPASRHGQRIHGFQYRQRLLLSGWLAPA